MQQNPQWGFTGQTANAYQSDLPCVCTLAQNGNPAVGATGAALVTKEAIFQPVFLGEGYVINEIGIGVTSEAVETTAHAWVAVYQGVGVKEGEELKSSLVGQSKDKTGSAFEPGAEGPTQFFALESPIVVSQSNAPHGYVYVAVYLSASGKIGKFLTVTTNATKVQNYKASSGLKVYPWIANQPLMAFKSKPTTDEGTAEAKIKEIVDVTVAPVLWIK
jgi:hypothetical protein